jgi:DNA-binding MarR family transcriptional regulator
VAAKRCKRALVDEVIREFRVSGNLDNALDNLAAGRLGINESDLHCLNIIENSGGLTAGALAAQAGLTNGAITGVLDRLEKAGFARRVSDPADRRKVKVEVTGAFYKHAERIWAPMAADWQSTLDERFSAQELTRIADFLRTTVEIGRRQMDRLGEAR